MLGDYVLHHPITDFPVALLVIAAMFQVACLVLNRPQWQVIADATLVVGFVGSLAAVGTGMWLVAVSDHGHSKILSIHHWFAYSALGVAAVATLALALSKRRPELAKVKIVALVISAGLVSAAGFFGGKMAHPTGEQAPHTHGDDGMRMPEPTESAPHEHGGEHGDGHGSSDKPATPPDTKPTEPTGEHTGHQHPAAPTPEPAKATTDAPPAHDHQH